MKANSKPSAKANLNSIGVSRPAPAEFHLLPEEMLHVGTERAPSGVSRDGTVQPIVIPAGVTCLVKRGGQWTAVALPDAGRTQAMAAGQNSHSTSPAGGAAASGENDSFSPPRFEPLTGRGPLRRLLMVNAAGHSARVNGLPAPRVSLLSANDRVQFDDSPTFRVAIYHCPQVGPVTPNLVGARCPVCTIPLTAEDQCLVCGCGAALHASAQPESSHSLDCARLASECPRCQQRLRLGPSYEPDDALSAAHE